MRLEIKLGRRVGRAELYCLTHTNKDGNPVDGFSATKIQDINKKLAENPSLIGEEAHEEDLYSTFFPKAKTSARHGLGLVVGGKTSEKIDQAIAAFRQSQVENKDLRRMVETLTENQKSLVENIERKCGEMVEQRCKELMVIFQASQNQNSTQQTSLEQKVEKVSKSVTARKEGTVVVKQHGPRKTTTAREEETVAVKQRLDYVNHVDIYKGHDLLRQRPELYAQIPPECGLKKKRKRTSGAAMNADDRKTNSQTVDKNQNKERMELEEPEQVKDGAKM